MEYTRNGSSGGVPNANDRRRKRKSCRFCVDQDVKLDYKEPRLLGQFLTDNAKILPRRITGNCARHQRRLTQEIKRARILAMLPFTVVNG